MKHLKPIFSLFVWILLSLILLAGCLPGANPTAAPAKSSPSPAAISASPTPSPAASATPTPTAAPARLVLVLPVGAPQPVAQEVQAALQPLAKSANLVLDVRPELKAADLQPEVRVVVWINAPADAAQLAAAAPKTAFALLSPQDIKPAANLSVIRMSSEHQAFASGLVAATLTPDWRAGALLPAGSPAAQTFQDAFMTGARYFCGRCMPGWPLGMVFPQVAALPPTSDAKAWQTAANDLIQNKKVEVVFLSPESASPDNLKFFAGKKLVLFGLQTPAEEFRSSWAVTVRMDAVTPLQKIFPDLTAGKGGAALSAGISLADIDVERLGAGRQKYILDILKDLSAGLINPLTVPGQ